MRYPFDEFWDMAIFWGKKILVGFYAWFEPLILSKILKAGIWPVYAPSRCRSSEFMLKIEKLTFWVTKIGALGKKNFFSKKRFFQKFRPDLRLILIDFLYIRKKVIFCVQHDYMSIEWEKLFKLSLIELFLMLKWYIKRWFAKFLFFVSCTEF